MCIGSLRKKQYKIKLVTIIIDNLNMGRHILCPKSGGNSL